MNRGSYQQRIIEHLAREAQLPVEEIAPIYDDVRMALAAGARITSFLDIFAIRNVRQMLRQRKLRASFLAQPVVR